MSARRLLAVVFGAIALMWVLAVFVSAAKAQEARCTELGASCVCSEPLEDTTTGAILSGHDFADSPPASECDQYGTFFAITGTPDPSGVSVVSSSGRELPAGNTVDRVLQRESGYFGGMWGHSILDPDASEARRCFRYHFMVSSDWSGVTGHETDPCPSGRNKMTQVTMHGVADQVQEKNSGGTCTGANANFCSGDGTTVCTDDGDCTGNGTCGVDKPYANLVLTVISEVAVEGNYNFDSDGNGSVDFADCQEGVGWCSLEHCVSGDLDGTGDNYQQARITTLSDGLPHTTEMIGPMPGPALTDTLNGANWDHGQSSNPNTGNGTGTMWISHYMEASWDSDAGQWIGPASEIEGGAADTDPPTPNPITGSDIAFSGVTSDEMTITISNVTDAGGSTPISYLFDCVSPGGCAFDSSWQTSNVYNPTGLAPATTYGWQITTRDSVPNTGSASATFSQATPALCGNGILDGGEECDDENAVSGDGCALCTVEVGWTCDGEPSICSPIPNGTTGGVTLSGAVLSQ